jgi:hypothetical protein
MTWKQFGQVTLIFTDMIGYSIPQVRGKYLFMPTAFTHSSLFSTAFPTSTAPAWPTSIRSAETHQGRQITVHDVQTYFFF